MKVYYGEETKKAIKNFPFSISKTKKEFILSIVKIKKAAAIANNRAGDMGYKVKDSILKACDEILSGKYDSQFPLSSLQGGASTATNMNVNEVISGIAGEFLGKKVHPNDDVNKSQSTNDVNPSALKIAVTFLLDDLEKEIKNLAISLNKKSKEFKSVAKLGRTHLQDAVPTTLGQEFESYSFNIERHISEIKRCKILCSSLNLGGTAIGNYINAKPLYIKELYKELNKITSKNFKKSPNLMAKTSGQVDFLVISQMIVSLCVDLSKIANDLRFMSSGPMGGIGEIILPELQKGSSIMPGKVNPVMPEMINQLYFLVSGNNLSIEKAVESSQMELGVMLPITADRLIESIKLTTEAVRQFNHLCISGIKADKEKCKYYLEKSTAYATLLVPYLGYDVVSFLVKKSLMENRTLRDITINEGYMKELEFNKAIKQSKILR